MKTFLAGVTFLASWVFLAVAAPAAAPPPPDSDADAVEPIGFHVWAPNGNSLCPSQNPPFNHWDLREFPACEVPYELNPNIPGGPSPAEVVQAVHLAADKWSDEKPSHIQLEDKSGLLGDCPVKPQFDGRNCFAWDPNFDIFPGALAATTVFVDVNTGVYTEVDITANALDYTWQGSPPTCNTGNPYGIEAVMVHEVGHFIGLAHPNQVGVPAGCGDDDPTGQTLMYSIYQNSCKLDVHQADWDGINYLYSADLGDLDDPLYPTLIHDTLFSRILSTVYLTHPNDGPEHLFGLYQSTMSPNFPRYQYEWLGIDTGAAVGAIDDHELECEARIANLDNFDDGALLIGNCTPSGSLETSPSPTLLVEVQTARDVRGRGHLYNEANMMFINAWFDWNDDGDFQDPGEHAVGSQGSGVGVTAPGMYGFQLTNFPLNTPCLVKHRVRLDYREDVGQTLNIDGTATLERGAVQHGEVEDYVGVYDPNGTHNTDPNRPLGPGGPTIPPWSPIYCHTGMTVVNFGGAGVNAGGFCHPPKPVRIEDGEVPSTVFPLGGAECMDSTLTLGLDFDQDEVYDEYVGLVGPVCVTRSDPYTDGDGYRVIDTQMVSLDMIGHSQLAGQIGLHLAPGQPSVGMIRQSDEAVELGVDVSEDALAFSYFEIYFYMESQDLGTSEVVGPVQATAWIGAVPPGEPNGQVPAAEVPVDADGGL